MSQIFEFSAKELAKKIRLKELSPIEVVHSHIQKIEETNPKLNAVCERFFDIALADAKAKTESMMLADPESLPPLFGVPFSIKEMFAFEGAHLTAGSLHRKENVSKVNSTVVQRLIDAGAIPLVTTNVPELGFWFECSNPIYGTTNNPYDSKRTPGGSSGGEAALIGSGGSPFGLGSDIGGSIRIPANFCGIFGHKPTAKTVPFTGHFPYDTEKLQLVPDALYTNTTAGTLCRKAEDMELLFETICGSDGIDPATLGRDQVLKNKSRYEKETFQPSHYKILYMPSPEIHMTAAVESEVSEKVSQVAQVFLELGSSIQEFDRRFFLRSVELWSQILKSTKNSPFAEALNPLGSIDYGREMLRIFSGKGRYTFPNLAVAMLENYFVPKHNSSDIITEHQILREKLLALMDEKTVLILPVHPRVAPKHHFPMAYPFDFIYSGIFTTLGFPSVAVPLGLNQQGIPTGIQIVTKPFCDHLGFRFAEILENLFGGWHRPQ